MDPTATPPPPSGNGWGEWKNLVLQQIQFHQETLNELRVEMARMRSDVADLRVLVAQANAPAISKSQEEITHKQVNMAEDIAALKVKAGIWGALGGLLAASVPFLLQLYRASVMRQ